MCVCQQRDPQSTRQTVRDVFVALCRLPGDAAQGANDAITVPSLQEANKRFEVRLVHTIN